MISTPPSLPQDRTEAPASPVRASASVSQVDSLPCPGNSLPGDNRSQEACASGPDLLTPGFPPTEPDSLVLQQHYQTLFEDPSPLHTCPPASTQQQLAQLQFQLVQSQQREEHLQLQLQVMRQDLWQQKFQQQQLQQQLYLQQQQHHPELYFASQNGPPSQELFPVNDGSPTSTQPWGSEVLC